MPLRTYGLLDVAGVKRAIQEGHAHDLLEDFWRAAETWANHRSGDIRARPLGENASENARVVLRTYSDSALLTTAVEYEIEDFYALALALKEAVDAAVGASYLIINRDDEIAAPAVDQYVVDGGGHQARYLNVGGSGRAFPNLYLADAALNGLRAWHDAYSLYCIGDESRPRAREIRDRATIRGCNRELLALG